MYQQSQEEKLFSIDILRERAEQRLQERYPDGTALAPRFRDQDRWAVTLEVLCDEINAIRQRLKRTL